MQEHPAGITRSHHQISPARQAPVQPSREQCRGPVTDRAVPADHRGHPRRTVAEEYFAVSEKAEALYGPPAQLSADAAGPKLTRLRREHHRLLGNGHCTRPPQLDCVFESICETCSYFQTSIEFRPAQHDHAPTYGQTGRQELFARLIHQIDDNQAS